MQTNIRGSCERPVTQIIRQWKCIVSDACRVLGGDVITIESSVSFAVLLPHVRTLAFQGLTE